MKNIIPFSLLAILSTPALGFPISGAEHQEALAALFPSGSFEWNDTVSGVLNLNGEKHAFLMSEPLDFDLWNARQFACSVRFDDYPESRFEQFLRGETLQRPSLSSRLLFAPKGQPQQVRAIPFAENAHWTVEHHLAVGDVLGTGDVQFQVRTTCAYTRQAPAAVIVESQREFLIQPTGEIRVALTGGEYVRSADELGPFVRRRIEYKQADPPQPPYVSRVDLDSGSVETWALPYGTSVVSVDRPWVVPILPGTSPASLELLVLNEGGIPLPGAQLHGTSKAMDLLRHEELLQPIGLDCDATGQATISFHGQLDLLVRSDGYYEESLQLSSQSVPNGPFPLPLTKELARIPVVTSEREVQFVSADGMDPIAVGLRLVQGYGPDENARWTSAAAEADLWIELTPNGPAFGQAGEPLWSDWALTVTGNGGWQVAAGPSVAEAIGGATMREAPNSGYEADLTNTVGNFADGIYLWNAIDGRYGKVWGFRYLDLSFGATTFQTVILCYLAQQEGTGTRSLNPDSLNGYGR